MCVIFVAYRTHPKYPLIVLANRDEFYDRPTLPAASWQDHPNIYAGRDKIAGGTWLGVADGGRFAAITNYREPSASIGDISRGLLASEFLNTTTAAENYLRQTSENADRYSGFNLLIGEFNASANELWYFSNRGAEPKRLKPGLYGLSNHLLNTSWPKVNRGLQGFAKIVSNAEIDKEDCFRLLSDETIALDEELPNTGVGIERERLLSPIFIRTPIYGTRSSTIVKVDNGFEIAFEEKVYV